MSKTAVILGATGQQGGGVARALLAAGAPWKVRAVTRNASSAAAQKLASSGAEIAVADADDIASLEKAFNGAYAIFAVTNFWEHLALGQQEAGKKEASQAWNIALAASRCPTLEHYLWSTLPHASAITHGAHKCAHFDYKAEIDARIMRELPELGKKTTFVWVAWYPTNMAYMPPIRMQKAYVPSSAGEEYVWIQASPPDSYLPASGNVSHNTGRLVLAALQHPSKTRGGKYIDVKTDTPTYQQIVDTWSAVTGKKAVYKQVSREVFEGMYSIAGSEMEDQYAFGTACGDWEKGSGKTFVGHGELGVGRGELVDLRKDLEGVREALL